MPDIKDQGAVKRLIAILMLAASSFALTGQTGPVGLEECIERALECSPEASLARTALEKSRISLKQSVSQLLPSLNVYVNQYYNWGRSVDMQELVIVKNRLTRQTSGSVGASFSIFDGFAQLNTVRMNRQLEAAAQDRVLSGQLQIKSEVARTYLACLLARLSRSRLQESYRNICLQAERLLAEADAGARKRSDIYQLEAKKAEALSQIAEAAAEEAVQMDYLQQLTGIPEPFALDTSFVSSLAPVPEETLADRAHLMPEVLAARHDEKAAEFALKAARGGLWPSLSLSAAYGTYYSDAALAPFRDQLDGNRNPSVSLSLVVPLFNAGKTAAAVGNAKAELEASRARLRQAENKARAELVRTRQQCHSLREQANAAAAAAEMSRQRLMCATVEYQAGAITTSQWTDACEDLAKSQCDHAQAICKYLFQLKLLEFYSDGIEGKKD